MTPRAIWPLLLLATLSAAQESKPTKPEKPASAPATRPTEMTVLGRKAALSVPADWVETKAPSSFALEDWKCAKAWEHTKLKGLSVHVFGVEGKDLNPATLIQKWFASAGKATPKVVVSVACKNKSLKGLDTEVDLDENGSISFYWLRAIAWSKDRVLLVMAEASPLRYDQAEAIVEAARPVLDSVLDSTGKDPWRREAAVTVTCGDLVTRLAVPAGWTYSRQGKDSFSWSGPTEGQGIELTYPISQFTAMTEDGKPLPIPSTAIYKAMTQIFEGMFTEGGKLISKTTIPGHDQASEVVGAFPPDPDDPNSKGSWTRRRIFLDGSAVILLAGTHPIPDVASLPPDSFQKQVSAVMDSLKLEFVKK